MQGIILLNKPKGITSFGAVAAIRRICGIKRVGHTGTLDPMAEGVLPVLVGRATALSSYITDGEKSYTAKVRLGLTTDTEDITGNILTKSEVSVTEERLKDVVSRFSGEQQQIPPMYSAISRDGVRLYQLARQGIEIEREARSISIYAIACHGFDGTEFYLDVTCSKGTYIRSLCRDIGSALGCGAVMTELIRTSSAGFSIDDAVGLETLCPENIRQYLLPADTALQNLAQLRVTEKQAVRFSNGGELDILRTGLKNPTDGMLVRVKFGEILLGIGRVDAQKGQIKVDCVINDKNGSDSVD